MGMNCEYQLYSGSDFSPELLGELEALGVFADVEDLRVTDWCSWEEDLRSISALFPEVLFILDCRTDFDDWRAYFRGGKMQSCLGYVEYEEFDEEELR